MESKLYSTAIPRYATSHTTEVPMIYDLLKMTVFSYSYLFVFTEYTDEELCLLAAELRKISSLNMDSVVSCVAQ